MLEPGKQTKGELDNLGGKRDTRSYFKDLRLSHLLWWRSLSFIAQPAALQTSPPALGSPGTLAAPTTDLRPSDYFMVKKPLFLKGLPCAKPCAGSLQECGFPTSQT